MASGGHAKRELERVDAASESEVKRARPETKEEQTGEPSSAFGEAEDAHAMPGFRSAGEVQEACQKLWNALLATGHPLQVLRDQLASKEYRKEFSKVLLGRMLQAHPDLRQTCVQTISEAACL